MSPAHAGKGLYLVLLLVVTVPGAGITESAFSLSQEFTRFTLKNLYYSKRPPHFSCYHLPNQPSFATR